MLDLAERPALVALEPDSTLGTIARPRRTLGTLVERFGIPIRESVEAIRGDLSASKVDLGCLLNGLRVGPGCRLESPELRAAWAIVGITLAHSALGRSPDAYEALSWFFAEHDSHESLASSLSESSTIQVSAAINAFSSASEIRSFLPYVLEQHGHVTRRSLENTDRGALVRKHKRESGVFYTPIDVAEFLVAELSQDCVGSETWFDPACGTGVFLRAALTAACDSAPNKPKKDPIAVATAGIYGIDSSAIAVEMAALVLLLECSLRNECLGSSPANVWRRLKSNLVCMDALRLFEAVPDQPLARLFNERVSRGFDRLIMNPPYAVQQVSSDVAGCWAAFRGARKVPVQLAFVEMMWRLSSTNGLAAAVLPLSIATNTQATHQAFRAWMANATGRKEFLFYDREPQSLFGEDVKTRSAVFFLDKQGVSSTFTSSLLKWTAAQRSSILSRARLVQISSIEGAFGIPRLGTVTQASAYQRLNMRFELDGLLNVRGLSYSAARRIAPEVGKNIILVGPTAYNYLNCFPANAIPADENEPFSESSLHAVECADPRQAWVTYAILSSRLFYWLWRIEGDGFHVTRSFLKASPLWSVAYSASVFESLTHLGFELWNQARRRPQRIINAGKVTFSYPQEFSSPESKSVESLMLAYFDLDLAFSDELDAFIDLTVSVDGRNRSRH